MKQHHYPSMNSIHRPWEFPLWPTLCCYPIVCTIISCLLLVVFIFRNQSNCTSPAYPCNLSNFLSVPCSTPPPRMLKHQSSPFSRSVILFSIWANLMQIIYKPKSNNNQHYLCGCVREREREGECVCVVESNVKTLSATQGNPNVNKLTDTTKPPTHRHTHIFKHDSETFMF